MWNKIFNVQCIAFLLKASGIREDKAHGEEMQMINIFIDFVKARFDYKVLVVMATQWDGYDDVKQANLAIKCAGEFHASRFIMLMDFLSHRYKKGELN